MVMAMSPASPSACISSMARVRRSISTVNLALIPMNASRASTVRAAMATPSTTWYGFRRRMARSLNVAGSPSAALHTT